GVRPREERHHRAGLAARPDGREAFEELLGATVCPQAHGALEWAVPDRQPLAPVVEGVALEHLRKLLLLRKGRRYLAKGNYNVTRLGYLLKLFPDARFVIPVRDPLWHVASLMKQHQLFCREEQRNPRVLRHMRRSGHFEFGLD